MTFVITQGCCNDASCVAVCPVQCIRPRPGDPDFTTTEQLYIDPTICIDCGACQDVCPVGAIETEWDLPQEMEAFLQINADYFSANPIEASALDTPVPRTLPAGRSALSVAIVGTGPAGSYAAEELSEINGVTVSVFDRLPTPFGLVRSGVAPDHANTKQITKRFAGLFSRPNVTPYLNVEIGRDVTLTELLEHHHAVIWAGGASDDRKLGVSGEDLEGCVSAREFVAWYNGHPDYADRSFDLSGSRVVVIGNGNVALDVARVLTRPVETLERTEMADHALEVLRRSAVEEVIVTARRGPEFAAYTTGELIGLHHVDGVNVTVLRDEVADAIWDNPHTTRLVEAALDRQPKLNERNLCFRFGLTPTRINGNDSVQSVSFRRADGSVEQIEACLVVRAIGYRGRAVDGLPFDEQTGTIPHLAGRVIEPRTGESVGGVYCSGWIKRGATGVIGTNRQDSAETVDSLLCDFDAGRLHEPAFDAGHLDRLIRDRQPAVVDRDGWLRIDQSERKAGRRARRPRAKFVTVEELLQASRAG